MNDQDVIRTLGIISKVYGRILDSSQSIVIPSAISSVRASKERYNWTKRNQSRGIEVKSWGYTISDDMPLRFLKSRVKDFDFEVDVYCKIYWIDDTVPIEQDIKVRLWSKHDQLIFDPDRDSQTIRHQLDDHSRDWQGRVISRFHFDKANKVQQGPKFHLQFGGNPKAYELCWHPSSVNIPRFQYHPMELFLTCQLVAANFFWDDYQEIKKTSEWRGALALCQNHLLLNHYRNCLNTLENGKSLLDSVWIS